MPLGCAACDVKYFANAGSNHGANIMHGLSGLTGLDDEGNYIPDSGSFDPSLSSVGGGSGGGFDTLTFPQYGGVPSVNAPSNVSKAVSSAFGAGVRVFESIFTARPQYVQQSGPGGSSTTVWGSSSSVPALTLNPIGGLSVTTLAMLALAGVAAFSLLGRSRGR